MSKIIKLNYTKKVRYIFDKETEENDQLGEKITDHFGSFIDNIWEMSDVKRFHKALRECGLSVEEFLAKDWISSTPKKKAPVKKKPAVKKKVVTEKPPAKKRVVRKKITAKKTPVKKRVVKKK
tara:strand:- start:423 stop:791 length:369 start_codon:yes stop_codon:yes gene_type:complete